MKMLYIFIGLCASVLCNQPSQSQIKFGEYDAKVNAMPIFDGYDNRSELRTCINSWRGNKFRSELLNRAQIAQKDHDILLWELAGSNAIGYQGALLIHGNGVKAYDNIGSSRRSQESKSESELIKLSLSALNDPKIKNYFGRPVFDGLCVFTTIWYQKTSKTIIAYAPRLDGSGSDTEIFLSQVKAYIRQ